MNEREQRNKSYYNAGDQYLTAEQRARLVEPPLILGSVEEMGRFLGGLRDDTRRIYNDILPDIDADRKRMSKDLGFAMAVLGGLTNGMQGAPGDIGAAIALAIATAAKPAPTTPTPGTTPASITGNKAPIEFPWESATTTASTETYAGADDILGTQAAAGCKTGDAGTIGRVTLNLPTALALAATFQVKVYYTYDGVTFGLAGSYTFTGDGVRKYFDSAAYSTPTPPAIVLPSSGVYLPAVQVGLVASATATTKGNVKLFYN